MLQVGVAIKQIENKHLQNLLIFRVWIIWGGKKNWGGTAPECLPVATGPVPSACGIEQVFSNYGSRPQMGSRNVILGLRNQLAWQIRYNNFCKTYKKIESRPVVNLFLLHFYF